MQEEMHWFGVALWRAWYPSALAYADVYVLAPSAFKAIETAMQAFQLSSVAYAAADLCGGGSLHYRAHQVRVRLDPNVVMEALSLVFGECPVPENLCRGDIPLRAVGSVCGIDGVWCELVEVGCYP